VRPERAPRGKVYFAIPVLTTPFIHAGNWNAPPAPGTVAPGPPANPPGGNGSRLRAGIHLCKEDDTQSRRSGKARGAFREDDDKHVIDDDNDDDENNSGKRRVAEDGWRLLASLGALMGTRRCEKRDMMLGEELISLIKGKVRSFTVACRYLHVRPVAPYSLLSRH
jgi:hypothetical protein